jgi:tRNA (guanine37-N1)-methyltransferase
VVAPPDAERARQALLRSGALRLDTRVRRDQQEVWLPVKGRLPDLDVPHRLARSEVPLRQRRGDLRAALRVRLGPGAASLRAFDAVGDVAVVDLPESLRGSGRQVGQAILSLNHQLRAAYAREGARQGPYRTWQLRWLAGRRGARTVHREAGARYQVDLRQSYFSGRLSTERRRIAALVQAGERVLVLFAGVGPFAIAVARHQPGCSVVAVEINPAAAADLEANIALNRVSDRVTAWQGDARDACRGPYLAWASRVLMPLPHSALEYVPEALAALSPEGGWLHIYSLAPRLRGSPQAAALLEQVGKAVTAAGRSLRSADWRAVRPYAPDQVQVVLEVSLCAQALRSAM